jgi:hypothetical protein
MKAALAGLTFDRPEELLDVITRFPKEIQVSKLKRRFPALPRASPMGA